MVVQCDGNEGYSTKAAGEVLQMLITQITQWDSPQIASIGHYIEDTKEY